MKFKKIYIEITNSCNFHCSFCFKSGRPKKWLKPEEFRIIAEKLKPFTNYIYLHVLGEPLLHPQLGELLEIASETGLLINITTNGGLLEQKKDILLNHPIRQVNISLHDAEENIDKANWDKYLENVLSFAEKAKQKTYVLLRLWNSTNADSVGFNHFCLEKIAQRFGLEIKDLISRESTGNGFKLTDHIFLQEAPRFVWPREGAEERETNKHCYALRDHIAILSDGRIVPCCLDADGSMTLGNIFTDDLATVLSSEKAINIKKGFAERRVVEPLCATCGFIV